MKPLVKFLSLIAVLCLSGFLVACNGGSGTTTDCAKCKTDCPDCAVDCDDCPKPPDAGVHYASLDFFQLMLDQAFTDVDFNLDTVIISTACGLTCYQKDDVQDCLDNCVEATAMQEIDDKIKLGDGELDGSDEDSDVGDPHLGVRRSNKSWTSHLFEVEDNGETHFLYVRVIDSPKVDPDSLNKLDNKYITNQVTDPFVTIEVPESEYFLSLVQVAYSSDRDGNGVDENYRKLYFLLYEDDAVLGASDFKIYRNTGN